MFVRACYGTTLRFRLGRGRGDDLFPIAVERVGHEPDGGQLCSGHFAVGGVGGGIQRGLHPQSGASGGRTEQFHDDLVAHRRAGRISEALEFDLPQAQPGAVAAAAVGADQQVRCPQVRGLATAKLAGSWSRPTVPQPALRPTSSMP